MKKRKALIWYALLGLIILIQVLPVERPSVSSDNPNDMITNSEIPVDIANKIKVACYDCHSNATVYPWYANVVPVKFLVYRDTRVGRQELNFSDWAGMSKIEQAGALDEISSEVLEGAMPLKIYPLTHPKAKLSDEDRQAIASWSEGFAESLFE